MYGSEELKKYLSAERKEEKGEAAGRERSYGSASCEELALHQPQELDASHQPSSELDGPEPEANILSLLKAP